MTTIVRAYDKDDRPVIERMYEAQGFSYRTPDWDKVLVSAVVETDGEIRMAGFLRKTAEAYLLFDPTDGTRKRDRIGQLMILQKELLAPAKRVGFEDAHCWLAPEAAERFGKLLLRLGWQKPLWPSFNLIPPVISHG